MNLVVARIDQDHISADEPGFNQEGREFEYQTMKLWYVGQNFGMQEAIDEVSSIEALKIDPVTKFKLYDDDDELYYEGWLRNDPGCIVQMFVLAWGESYAGCTKITIYKNAEAGYVQEIG